MHQPSKLINLNVQGNEISEKNDQINFIQEL